MDYLSPKIINSSTWYTEMKRWKSIPLPGWTDMQQLLSVQNKSTIKSQCIQSDDKRLQNKSEEDGSRKTGKEAKEEIY